MSGWPSIPPKVGPTEDVAGFVGKSAGTGPTWRGRYVGLRDDLKGKTALLRRGENPGDVVAQFDDRETGYGWWLFYGHQFVRARKPAKGWRKHNRATKANRRA